MVTGFARILGRLNARITGSTIISTISLSKTSIRIVSEIAVLHSHVVRCLPMHICGMQLTDFTCDATSGHGRRSFFFLTVISVVVDKIRLDNGFFIPSTSPRDPRYGEVERG